MLRWTEMRRPCRIALVLALACFAAAGARDARAQTTAPADTALLVVFEHDTPIARERSVFRNMGDSLVVTATTNRDFLDDQQAHHAYRKSMMLVVDSRDLGLIRYLSTEDFNGHQVVRGLIPGDTSMTYYRELDGGGDADRLVQPPGRLYVMDSQMFSLFDVLCRSL